MPEAASPAARAPQTVRILGIDPGSRLTGFGLIDASPARSRCVTHGVIRTGDGDLASRLGRIFEELAAVIREHAPAEIAMEQVFVQKNVATALVLGQARGAALCAVAVSGRPFHEYAPARIKQAVAGSGRADKPQMQRMVRMLLALPEAPPPDAADALACALCHAHSRTLTLTTARLARALRP
ncbi:MAG TPA: crossover junction endodeoxyribonuclease RuvC [Candidatus Binatia bacterium]|nr:crossover junction endodeoxyribonuclease RuvC [Candidatus Binatia bacterium]